MRRGCGRSLSLDQVLNIPCDVIEQVVKKEAETIGSTRANGARGHADRYGGRPTRGDDCPTKRQRCASVTTVPICSRARQVSPIISGGSRAIASLSRCAAVAAHNPSHFVTARMSRPSSPVPRINIAFWIGAMPIKVKPRSSSTTEACVRIRASAPSGSTASSISVRGHSSHRAAGGSMRSSLQILAVGIGDGAVRSRRASLYRRLMSDSVPDSGYRGLYEQPTWGTGWMVAGDA